MFLSLTIFSLLLLMAAIMFSILQSLHFLHWKLSFIWRKILFKVSFAKVVLLAVLQIAINKRWASSDIE